MRNLWQAILRIGKQRREDRPYFGDQSLSWYIEDQLLQKVLDAYRQVMAEELCKPSPFLALFDSASP